MNFWLLTLLIFMAFTSRVMVEDSAIPRDDNDDSYEYYIQVFDKMSQESFWEIAIRFCMFYQNYNTTQFSEYENENISRRLDQLYAERFEDPSSQIMKEVVYESPKLSTPHKLTLIETYQAHKSDFDEVEKNIESYSRKLATIRNLLSENTSNGSKLLDEDSMRTNQNVSMLINTLGSRLEFLAKANLHMGCYIGQVVQDKEFKNKYRRKKMSDDEVEKSRYDDEMSKLIVNTLYVMTAVMFLLF